MTRFPCVSVHRPISDNINIVSLSIRHLWTQTTPLAPSLPLSLSIARSLSLARSHTPLPHTHSMSLPNSLLPRPHPCYLATTHVTPFPLPLYWVYIISGLSTPHTHTPSHTQTRAQTHTDTHKHPFIWILISPHVRMCISHTHSLIMYMCLHVTQHKAPCTCLSLSSTHIDTKNL